MLGVLIFLLFVRKGCLDLLIQGVRQVNFLIKPTNLYITTMGFRDTFIDIVISGCVYLPSRKPPLVLFTPSPTSSRDVGSYMEFTSRTDNRTNEQTSPTLS